MDRPQKVQELQNLAGISEAQADAILAAHGDRLEDAVEAYLAHGAEAAARMPATAGVGGGADSDSDGAADSTTGLRRRHGGRDGARSTHDTASSSSSLSSTTAAASSRADSAPDRASNAGAVARPTANVQLLWLVVSVITLPFQLLAVGLRSVWQWTPFGRRRGLLRAPAPSSVTADAAAKAAVALYRERFGTAEGPAWYPGAYRAAIEQIKQSADPLLVVLGDPDTDADAYDRFCRAILNSPQLAAFLQNTRAVAWLGHVSHLEAYQVARLTRAQRFPCIGLIACPDGRPVVIDTVALRDDEAARLHRAETRPAAATRRAGGALPEPGPAAAAVAETESEAATVARALMSRLEAAYAPVALALAQRQRDAAARAAARQIRAQQDRAYQASLEADRAKAAKRAEAEAAAAARAAALAAQQVEAAAALARETARRARLAAAFGDPAHEPAAEAGAVTRISFRLGSGQRLVRRFRLADPVQTLYDFVDSQPESLVPLHAKVSLYDTFPRRELTDRGASLAATRLTNATLAVDLELDEPAVAVDA
ncbi:hypothetical protein CXG81DRAFT_24884 [Caulochytrium protostelioides]|uniref:UBX domain-containing protein n=1 Tax=Caulochytrium protostelioides TaxID=1555241 RepID=A0A4P9XBJ5_9FUNG|nr:hypothetical protein CXG81DRAFT_24884 [Caulochytrium protostelioides]|eukprot:RKP02510.1 hypothetical protein CXG81DRAFT_24884 [Caulochytrium protostelioides]